LGCIDLFNLQGTNISLLWCKQPIDEHLIVFDSWSDLPGLKQVVLPLVLLAR
jgi:hypothetical protein